VWVLLCRSARRLPWVVVCVCVVGWSLRCGDERPRVRASQSVSSIGSSASRPRVDRGAGTA